MLVYIVGLGAVIYTAAYYHFYAKKPKLYVKSSSKFHKFLHSRMTVLQQAYYPPFWCPEGRFQTIVKVFVPFLKKLEYKREVVPSDDGGQFYIDWIENDDSVKYPDKATRPTVFIVPGLTSTSKSNYVLSMADICTQLGFRTMVIINRGLDGMDVLTPKAYCATHTMDMELAIIHFKKRYPDAPLITIGISLGSCMVGRYLALKKDDSKLAAAMLFSCPFSPPHCTISLERWENKLLFNSHLTRSLKGLYGRLHHLFTDVVDHDEVLQSTTIREYDSAFTAKVFGYNSVEEYYHDAVLTKDKLNSFCVPTLCIGSDDDPFSPYEALPFGAIMDTENVALIVTNGGGHVSHMEGNPFGRTYFEKVMEQFIRGVFNDALK